MIQPLNNLAMTDSSETKIDQLRNLDIPRHAALAWVRGNGHCEYCHRDLIEDRLGYAIQETDHLLPQIDFTANHNNAALSCAPCNRVKGAHNVLKKGESPETMLAQHREDLIVRAREYIESQYKDRGYDRAWGKVKGILLG